MAAYRRVYDSRHMQADCQEPGSAPEPYAELIEYGLPLPLPYRYGSKLGRLVLNTSCISIRLFTPFRFMCCERGFIPLLYNVGYNDFNVTAITVQ